MRIPIVVLGAAGTSGGKITHGCFDDVKMWMSGGNTSGLSNVPTRTKLNAGPPPA